MSDKKWFTWLRRPMSMHDILEEDAGTRPGMSESDIRRWMDKYRLTGDSRVLWAMTYEAAKKEAEYWDGEGTEPRQIDPSEYEGDLEEIAESVDELDGRRLLIVVR